MDLKDFLTNYWPIALPFLTFLLGILSGGFIIPRLTAKRKILAWAVVSENDIVPREMEKTLGVPVVLRVGDEISGSLSVVSLKVGSGGNDVIDKTEIAASFNPNSKVLNARLRASGEFQKRMQWRPDGSTCFINVDFLNPGQSVDVEIVLSNYSVGSVSVDAAAPGLEVRRQEVTRWNLSGSLLKTMAFSFAGIQYSPGTMALHELVGEVRGLRERIVEHLHAVRIQQQPVFPAASTLKAAQPDEQSGNKTELQRSLGTGGDSSTEPPSSQRNPK